MDGKLPDIVQKIKKKDCQLVCLIIRLRVRGVAQPGSALAWGARGRRFKSFRPDQ